MTGDEQRIARLERQVQALVEEYAEQIYGHKGPVEWSDDEGWLRVVPNRFEAAEAAAAGGDPS